MSHSVLWHVVLVVMSQLATSHATSEKARGLWAQIGQNRSAGATSENPMVAVGLK